MTSASFVFSGFGNHRDLHVLTHSFPTRRSSDLLNTRAFVEGARALSGWTALQLDRAHAHAEPAERAKSDAIVALLTPVVKAAFTDFGFESAEIGRAHV